VILPSAHLHHCIVQLRAPQLFEPDLDELASRAWLGIPSTETPLTTEQEAADGQPDVYENDPTAVRAVCIMNQPASHNDPGADTDQGENTQQRRATSSASDDNKDLPERDAECSAGVRRRHATDDSKQEQKEERKGAEANQGAKGKGPVPHARSVRPWAIANEALDPDLLATAEEHEEWAFHDFMAAEHGILPVLCYAAMPDWETAVDFGVAESDSDYSSSAGADPSHNQNSSRCTLVDTGALASPAVDVESDTDDAERAVRRHSRSAALTRGAPRWQQSVRLAGRGMSCRARPSWRYSWDNVQLNMGQATTRLQACARKQVPNSHQMDAGEGGSLARACEASGQVSSGSALPVGEGERGTWDAAEEVGLPGLKQLSLAPAWRELLDSGTSRTETHSPCPGCEG
jgi:hypothetical protein